MKKIMKTYISNITKPICFKFGSYIKLCKICKFDRSQSNSQRYEVLKSDLAVPVNNTLVCCTSLVLPDPLRTGAYRLEIISAVPTRPL